MITITTQIHYCNFSSSYYLISTFHYSVLYFASNSDSGQTHAVVYRAGIAKVQVSSAHLQYSKHGNKMLNTKQHNQFPHKISLII